MMPPFTPAAEARAIEASVRRRGITQIFHFTPLSQVPRILAHGGIHPRNVLRARGIVFNDDHRRWSAEARKSEELAQYVATGIARPWGMMQHEPNCVVFGLNAQLLWRSGTSFLGGWSSRNEIAGIADVRARQTAGHFDAMFDNPTSAFPAPLPGEVLLDGSVPLQQVVAVYAKDEAHRQLIQATVREAQIAYRGPTLRLQVASWIYGVR